MKTNHARKVIHIFLAYLLVATNLIPAGTAFAQGNVMTGCADPVVSTNYSAGFNLAHFNHSGVKLDGGKIHLETAQGQLDPNEIVIPVPQQVAVTFLYEGAGFTKTNFGWMYANDTKANGDPDFAKVRWIYTEINDNNNDGVLDMGPNNTTPKYGDANGDGVIDVKDNRKILTDNGQPVEFKAGDEIVFVVDSSPNGSDGGIFYSKVAWNETFTKCDGGFSKIYQLYKDVGASDGDNTCYSYYANCYSNQANCHEQGWMDQDAITRIREAYGYNFRTPITTGNNKDPDGFNEVVVSVKKGDPLPHFILAAPDEAPNAWILGVEDLKGGGDLDYNDIVFLIERETGGIVELKPEEAIDTGDPDAFFTKVEMEVWDQMPCNGQSTIQYFLSVDYEIDENGNYLEDEDGNKIPVWKEIRTSDWTEVKSFTVSNQGNITLSTTDISATWRPGAPSNTYRKAVIDLVSENRIGRELLWKAEFKSDNEGCVPKLFDVKLGGNVAKHAAFSRSAPIIQTNILYAGSYRTPNPKDTAWMKEPVLRGSLKAFEIYDPETFTTIANEDSSSVWDAGHELSVRPNLLTRNIYYPNITVTKHTETLGVGDGYVDNQGRHRGNTAFSGTLSHHPVLDGTLVISAQTTRRQERFRDLYADDFLKTDVVGASGSVDRFNGQYQVAFADPPREGEKIVAHYSYYTLQGGALRDFDGTQVNADLLNLTAQDAVDVPTLVAWVYGIKPDGTRRPWPLGAIDRSAPAVLTPPGLPEWFFGSAVPDAIKNAFYLAGDENSFREANQERPTVVFVGSRSGMLHAFDGGEFRWGDNPKTTTKENRGYFEWDGNNEPQYGDGHELWAYIPGNLVPKMKNNFDMYSEGSKAYVDASPALSDVYVNGAWKTVVVFAQGDGGHNVTCLDVTDPMNPYLMWEFGHPGLFESQSSPAIGQIKDSGGSGQWVAFFNSGKAYGNAHPSIFAIDIATGTLLNDSVVQLDSAGANGLGSVPSGQPAAVDSNRDGYIDKLYVGSDKGYMYRVDLSNPANIADSVINGSQRVAGHGIHASPAVVVEPPVNEEEDYKVRIFFGTGGNSSTETYKFFAYVDTEDTVTLDWSYELPAGHRAFTSAFAAAGQVYFTTTTAVTEDPCEAGGTTQGNIYAFKQKLSDMDGQASPIAESPLPLGSGRVTPVVDDEHLYIKNVSGDLMSFGSGVYNNVAAAAPGTVMVEAMLQSWREVFEQ